MSSMILCTDLNGGLGYKGQLLYHISDDLKRFKQLTTNNIVLMGRKTYESMGSKPLPNRVNLVVSNSLEPENDLVNNLEVGDLSCIECFMEEYIDTSKELGNNVEPFIIGGQSLYEHYINEVDRVYLTLVLDDSKPHDAEFNFDLYIDDFELESSELRYDEKNKVWYQFKNYIRKVISHES